MTFSLPSTSSSLKLPIFPDLKDFTGGGVFFRVFYKMLLSYIFWLSVVKYGIISNNRGSKLHAVIDFVLLLHTYIKIIVIGK